MPSKLSRPALLKAAAVAAGAALALATQCGCGNIDYVTSHRIAVFLMDDATRPTRHELEDSTNQWLYYATRATVGTYNWTMPQLMEAISGMQLHVWDESLECGNLSPNGKCGGLTYLDQKLVKLGYNPDVLTFCQSSWWHELIHIALCEINHLCGGGTNNNSHPLFKAFQAYRCVPPATPAEPF